MDSPIKTTVQDLPTRCSRSPGAAGRTPVERRPTRGSGSCDAGHRRGEALLAPSITRRLVEEFATRRRPAKASGHRLDLLTERETQVFRLIARGLSNAEIAGTLFLGESTVKTYIGHILAKLGLRDRVQAVIVACGSGRVERACRGERLGARAYSVGVLVANGLAPFVPEAHRFVKEAPCDTHR